MPRGYFQIVQPSYNRRISSMEDVIIIERRTSRLHQRSRSSSSRSPRECHRSRTAHHPGKRRKSTGAFIFSCRLPAARAIATRGPLLCQIRRRHQPARMPPFATGRNRVTSGQSTEAGRPTDSVNLSLGCRQRTNPYHFLPVTAILLIGRLEELPDALLAKLQVGADDARGMAMHRIQQADLLLGQRVVWHHSSKVSIAERGSREKRG